MGAITYPPLDRKTLGKLINFHSVEFVHIIHLHKLDAYKDEI